MTQYVRKPGKVEASQFFYGRPMIPGVVYPADRSGNNEQKQRPYIFIDDYDNKQFLQPGDWVVMEDNDEGNMTFYVIKPQAFDLLFIKEDTETEPDEHQEMPEIWHKEPHGKLRLALAAYAHQAWSQWMRYMFSKGETRQINFDGGVSTYWLMPSDLYHRWQRQLRTPYADLPDKEKVSDLAEADKIMDVVRNLEPD